MKDKIFDSLVKSDQTSNTTRTGVAGYNKKTINRLNTINSIQQAALKVFAQYGFDGATTKEIAKESGYSEGLIFKYFSDKQGLFNALVDTWLEYSIIQLKQLKQYPDSIENELREIIGWFFKIYHSQPELNKIALSQRFIGNTSPEVLEKRLCQVQERKSHILYRFEIHKNKKHIAHDVNLESLYNIIQSYTVTEVIIKNISPKQTSAQINELLRIILHGIKAN